MYFQHAKCYIFNIHTVQETCNFKSFALPSSLTLNASLSTVSPNSALVSQKASEREKDRLKSGSPLDTFVALCLADPQVVCQTAGTQAPQ